MSGFREGGKGSSVGFSSAAKHQRVTTGSIVGAGSAAVTLVWTTPFSNANYTVSAAVVEATASTSTLRVDHVESVTATQVVVRILNADAVNAKTGTLHVIATQD